MRAARAQRYMRLERHVRRVAERPVGLDRPVDDVVQDRRAVVLDHRDLVARRRRADLVHLPRGVQRHQSRRVHLGARVGDPVLDGLLLGEQRPVREAADRALAHHVEGPLGLAEPAHAVVDPPGAEARLGEQEAGAFRADEVVCAGMRTST